MGKYVEFLKLCIPYMESFADVSNRLFESTNLKNTLIEQRTHAPQEKQEKLEINEKNILKEQNDIRKECAKLGKELNTFVDINKESIQFNEEFITSVQEHLQALVKPILQDLAHDLSWQTGLAEEKHTKFVSDFVSSYLFRISCEWHDFAVKENKENHFRITTILWFLRKILSHGFCFEAYTAENYNSKEISILKKPEEVLNAILKQGRAKESDFKHLLLLLSPNLEKSFTRLLLFRAELTVVQTAFKKEFDHANQPLSQISHDITGHEKKVIELLNILSKSDVQVISPEALDKNETLIQLIQQGNELFEKSFTILEKECAQLEETEFKLQKKSAGRRHHSDKQISHSQSGNENKKGNFLQRTLSLSILKLGKNNGKEEVDIKATIPSASLATNKEVFFSPMRIKKTPLQAIREAIETLTPYSAYQTKRVFKN